MIRIGSDSYDGRSICQDELRDPAHWRQLDRSGQWDIDPSGITGRWISDSPSLFFSHEISGSYLWQTTVTRLRPGPDDLRRMSASKHWQNADPLYRYNYNFWLRASDPSGSDFLESYPARLGTGWNGMGDDYWNSIFATVVWNPDSSWTRLRRSPGYVMQRDVQDTIPHLPYDQPHTCTFALVDQQVRMYYDDRLVYDWRGDVPSRGYIGLCVWLCKMRFTDIRLYQL